MKGPTRRNVPRHLVRRPALRLLLLVALVGTAGCGGDPSPPPSPIPAPCGATPATAFRDLFDDTFRPLCPDASGSGAFGTWIVADRGTPAYAYTMNHHEDPRAAYFTSWGDSRDHWHQLGNHAVTATAHNEGFVQLWDWTRGGTCVNRRQPELNHHGGGFRILKADGETWNTLYRPEAFQVFKRVFGLGFFEKETLRNGLRVRERTYSPYGEDPILLSETEIRNLTDAPREVLVYEYWDYNLYQTLIAPVMTAPLGLLFETFRWLFNGNFVAGSFYDPEEALLAVVPALAPGVAAPPPDTVSPNDYYPRPCFLASLTGAPDVHYADQEAFLGEGGIDRPDAVLREDPSVLLPAGTSEIGRGCLVLGRRLRLAPGERAFLAYAFGTGPLDDILPRLEAYRRDPEANFTNALAAWIDARIDFTADGPDAASLRRELLWHGYYLPAGSFRESYFDTRIVNQGSAYAYIHGANGAHRDFALFAMPLVYLDPGLARDILRYTMRAQEAGTGKIPYAHQGYGYTTGALVHEASSDLDLFFLLAFAEYVGATRDFSFLEETLPYYPLSSGAEATVREHVVKALDHLEQEVGTGPNGLIRAGSGDWNDVLIAFSPDPVRPLADGESNLNSGMACFLFPRLAEILAPHMPTFSERLEARAEDLRDRLRGEWTGAWMRRGYLGNGSYLGEDQIFLDAQAWPLLAGLWSAEQARTLLGNIRDLLVAPSPSGALCLYPPNEPPFFVPGSDTNGGTWAAIDSWVAWAWSLYDPAAAWDLFRQASLQRQAEAYPDVWYGVWSGPDSLNAFYADRPGETFNWSVTPMTDFPIMNMNRHSGPLLDAIRLAGIDPLGASIRISPRVPFDRLSLRLPLMGLAYLRDRHRGYYRPVCEGSFRFEVRLPAALDCGRARVLVDDEEVPSACVDDHARFEVRGGPGDKIRWEILPPP